MRTLYDIAEDFRVLDDLLLEAGGDMTGFEEAVDALLRKLDQDLETKADNYAAYIQELRARAAARREEARRLSERARADENKADRLQERLMHFFEERGIRHLETPRYSLRVRTNGGRPPVELDPTYAESPEKLPEPYRRVQVKPDLKAIADALEAGEELPFARFGERGRQLQIR
ncbi:MAG: hypothetical protein D6698_17390 [Gammaproteobacteria bacterium]|nr:MAG: hypothetical protein D6698_17390 [Gammaproteobacteria bacterium]